MSELSPETEVMLYNGRRKLASDLSEEDVLMGDDSEPRYIGHVTKKRGDTYLIKPFKGSTYKVGAKHTIATRSADYTTYSWSNKEMRFKAKYFEDGYQRSKDFKVSPNRYKTKVEAEEAAKTFLDTYKKQKCYISQNSISEYNKKTARWKVAQFIFRTPIEYRKRKVPIDPYIIGHWLGDGTSETSQITTKDAEIVTYYKKYFSKFNLDILHKGRYRHSIVRKRDKTGILMNKRNIFKDALRELNLLKNKHIPKIYLYNSRKNRMKLLAGLIDSDGSNAGTAMSFVQKNKRLAKQVQELSNGLGFWCTSKEREYSCTYKGERKTGLYQHLYIAGEFFSEIPLLLEYKRPSRNSKPKAGHCSIKVIPDGKGEIVKLDIKGKDKKIVLGDFTVTGGG